MTTTPKPQAKRLKRGGYVLNKVTVNGIDYTSPYMPDRGWWVYPHQGYKVVIDDLEGKYFRLEYSNRLTQLKENR